MGGLRRERGGGGKGKLVVSGCELEELMALLLRLPCSVSESEDESPYEANKASISFLLSRAPHTSDLRGEKGEKKKNYSSNYFYFYKAT